MAIERDNKVLDGAGLLVYTGLIKNELDGITTTWNGNLEDAIGALVGEATENGNTLEKLEDRVEEVEGSVGDAEGAIGELAEAIDGITTTTIPGIIEEINGITTDIESIHSDIDGITTSVGEMQEDIDSITSTIANLGNDYKALQQANTITLNAGEYIVGLAQDEQGVITATTAVLPAPSTASDSAEGLVQLASGATNAVVYSADQVDEIASSITTTIEGLGSTYKAIQTALTITAASGSFISGLEQDKQGVITASTTALPVVPEATDAEFGLVQMASGSTTAVVYDTVYVDGIEAVVNGLTSAVEQNSGAIDDIIPIIEGLTTTYKPLQNATTITASAGSYISEISQNEQGVVTATTTALPTIPNASSTTVGLVQMASGATTNEVYDKDQILGLIAGVSGDVSGLTNTFKQLQNAVSNPVASGSTISFISGISQDAQGIITPVAMTIPTASTVGVGLVQMASGSTVSVVYGTDEVDRMIAEQAAASFVAAVTATLPATADADNNTIYFIANGVTTGNNIYDEYLKVNTGSSETPTYAMEKIGSTEFSFETLSSNEIATIWSDTPAAGNN